MRDNEIQIKIGNYPKSMCVSSALPESVVIICLARVQSMPAADYNTRLCPTPPFSHSKQPQSGNRCSQFQLTKPSTDISNDVLFLKPFYDPLDSTIYSNWLLSLLQKKTKRNRLIFKFYFYCINVLFCVLFIFLLLFIFVFIVFMKVNYSLS